MSMQLQSVTSKVQKKVPCKSYCDGGIDPTTEFLIRGEKKVWKNAQFQINKSSFSLYDFKMVRVQY